MLGLSKSERFRAHVAHAALGLDAAELSFVLGLIRTGLKQAPAPLRKSLENKQELLDALEEVVKHGYAATQGGPPHKIYDDQLSAQCQVILDKVRRLSEEENFGELAQRILHARIGLKPIELHFVLNLITHGLPKLGKRQPENLDQLLALVQLIVNNPAKAWGDKPDPEEDRRIADNWRNIFACLQRLKRN